MSGSNHDEMLFEMLKECKTLPSFLDEIFGFLQRRTDFYHIAKDANSAVGLPEGLSEKLVKHTFLKFKTAPSEVVYSSNNIPIAKEETIMENSENINEVSSTTKDEARDFNFSKAECYNGGLFENYCWSQTITDIDVIIKIPENHSTKDIVVNITPGRVCVKLKNGTTLLEDDLCKKCKANDAVWSVDGPKLLIHLDKCQEIWWNCLVEKEPKIDVSKIDCSRPYDELPEDAQAKIEELQWNQERKRLGLPTSDELAMQETLKKAWHAEGSPFSGPFDPNCVKFN